MDPRLLNYTRTQADMDCDEAGSGLRYFSRDYEDPLGAYHASLTQRFVERLVKLFFPPISLIFHSAEIVPL